MHRYHCAAALLALITPVLAMADTPATVADGAAPVEHKRPALAQLFKSADANGDKKLDLAEIHSAYPKFPQERFAALDKNGDGALEPSEMPKRKDAKAAAAAPAPPAAAGPRAEMGKKIRAADTDKDEKLSLAEFTAAFPNAPAERFATMDRNGDGFVDRSDRETAAAVMPEKTDRPRKKAREDGSTGADRAETAAYLERLIRKHDQNNDGKVTKEELEAAKPGFPDKSFAALDRDKDGALSQADTPKAGA